MTRYSAPRRASSKPRRASEPQLPLTRAEQAQLEDVEERIAREKAAAPPSASTSVPEIWWCWDHDTREGCRQWTGGLLACAIGKCRHCGRPRPPR